MRRIPIDPRRAALAALLYFPSRELAGTPGDVGLAYEELSIRTSDGQQLHGWWLPARTAESHGHILFCHGNAGNIADRLLEAAVLTAAGFDVLLFDYRGYGKSGGHPDAPGTYHDARAAREVMLAQPKVDPGWLLYLGESLGGAVALELAVAHPPAGVILQSTFTSIRAIARHHYPVIPSAVIPDWYPSLNRITRLSAPLLLLHGDRDDIVPLAHGRRLYDAAPEPKQIHVFSGSGHNDLVTTAGAQYGEIIANWAGRIGVTPVGGGRAPKPRESSG
jgi:fermentation-respiration switch protein FrsA (DUF1100 family)